MKAIELNGQEGSASLRLVDVEKPKPAEQEVLIEVKAAGVNYADVELSRGNYPASRPLPYIIGFEASGFVVELGSQEEPIHYWFCFPGFAARADKRMRSGTSGSDLVKKLKLFADKSFPLAEAGPPLRPFQAAKQSARLVP
jgi:NADPH2:quinone reductase